MSSEFSLSYVLSTRNKLPMLREVLTRLLQHRQPDEEIIVIDAASTDGTTDYLRDLHRAGAIQQLVSEPDRGEAHGYNKGLLRARGELIKVITDDDAFHWPSIQICREFMQRHPALDLLGTNGGMVWSEPEAPFAHNLNEHGFERYRSGVGEFEFPGLGLMFRRAALALTGLFDPRFRKVDFEFALRVSSGPANLAWFTGSAWVRIQNALSNSVTGNERITAETYKLNRFYGAIFNEPSLLDALRDSVRGVLRPLKRKLLKPKPVDLAAPQQRFDRPVDWAGVFSRCDAWLTAESAAHPGQFLTR